MLHRVKIAMGGTRVLKYSCFWREIHPCGWHARFKVRLLAGHSVPYTDIQSCVRATSWWSKSLSAVYNIYVESMLYLG